MYKRRQRSVDDSRKPARINAGREDGFGGGRARMTDLARFISCRRRRQLISTGLEPVPGQSAVVLSTSAGDQRPHHGLHTR